MKIEVNIEKKYFFIILGVILILGAGIFVYAYNSNPPVPSNFGHSINEVDGITCATGQAVTRNATGWSCVNVVGGGSSGSICRFCLSCGGDFTHDGGGIRTTGDWGGWNLYGADCAEPLTAYSEYGLPNWHMCCQ